MQVFIENLEMDTHTQHNTTHTTHTLHTHTLHSHTLHTHTYIHNCTSISLVTLSWYCPLIMINHNVHISLGQGATQSRNDWREI